MSDENAAYPFYVGSSPPNGYVQLGGNLYIIPNDSNNNIYAKQLLSSDSEFTKLDSNASWGVNNKLVLRVDVLNFDGSYVTQYRDTYADYKYPAGRKLKDGRYSSALYFDRTGLNNDLDLEQEVLREPGKPKYLNIGTSDVNELYLLLPNLSVQFCCKNNALGDECGLGKNALNSKNSQCIEYAKKICTKSNPKAFFGQFCQREYCKTDPSSIKPGNCDNDYKELCNIKQDLSVSAEQYPYYNKYPDYCSCFMGKEFLTPMCQSYVDMLGIKRNVKAQNALSLNINDPNQCKDSCKIHPLCKLGAQVPYQMNRGDNPVVLGANFPQECTTTDLCVQDVTVNQTGNNIGKLTIKQEGNCKTTLQKVCARSTFTPCTGANVSKDGKTITYKKFLKDDFDDGQCADPGTAFTCAEFKLDLDTIKNATCDTSKQIVKVGIYNTYTSGFEPDVLMAANHLINDMGKLENINKTVASFKDSKLTFDALNSIVNVNNSCQNCSVDYDYSSKCTLDSSDKKWKQTKTLTKIVNKAINGGESCKIDRTPIKIDCTLNNDCIVTKTKEDTNCINGIYTYSYDIKSYNSGDGKACSDVILDNLSSKDKSQQPSVNIDYTSNKATLSFNCNNCVIDYVPDEKSPDGKCHQNKAGKYVITKYATVIQKESEGGTCQDITKVKNKEYIETPCTFNQDCVFLNDPVNDNCDDTVGIRTIKYKRDTLESGNGKACNIVGDNLKNAYLNVIDSYYDETDKTQTIKTSCDLKSDCLVKLESSKCDTKIGKRTYKYNIIEDSKSSGMSCEDVVKSIVNTTGTITRDGKNIMVEEPCEKTGISQEELDSDKKKYSIASIIIFIIIILVGLFLL